MGKEKAPLTKANHVVTIPVPRPVIQLGAEATTTGVVSGAVEGGAPQSGIDREVTDPLVPVGHEGVAAPLNGVGESGVQGLAGAPVGDLGEASGGVGRAPDRECTGELASLSGSLGCQLPLELPMEEGGAAASSKESDEEGDWFSDLEEGVPSDEETDEEGGPASRTRLRKAELAHSKQSGLKSIINND